MFSGIIQSVNEVAFIEQHGNSLDLAIKVSSEELLSKSALGSSIAINGVCLTVAERAQDKLIFNVSSETARITNLGDLKENDAVNVEPSLIIGDSLDGHFVTGHVDALGEVVAIETQDEYTELKIFFNDELKPYIAKKCSICIDGVSLTVNKVDKNSFSVMIVPHTLKNTIIQFYNLTKRVNLEIDVIARYTHSILKQSS
jgi:riboflavin synthase